MVLKIGGSVPSMTETSNLTRQTEALQVQRGSDFNRYVSTITQGKSGVISGIKGAFTGGLNKVWGLVKWVISKVFCCYDFSSVFGGKSQIEQLKEHKEAVLFAKAELNRLIEQHGRTAKTRAAFAESWVVVFDQLPQEVKERLQRIFFKDLAEGKGLYGEEEVTEFVATRMKSREECNKALRYFRNLETTPGIGSGSLTRTVDPLDDEELPEALKAIFRDIEGEITLLQKG